MNGTPQVDLAWLSAQFPDLSGLTPLDRGTFKLVFAAAHPTDGPVVLKVIHPQQGFESIRREILATEQVQSSRVPRIFGQGTLPTQIGDCVWVREQRIDGQTVRQCLHSGALPSSTVLRLGVHVLEVLADAERVKIVHRDIKPENLICTPAGDFWVLDFGIARHLQLESMTQSNAPFGRGTWGYAPPEQCRNVKLDIDARSDLFALGVTLFECATGSNPFITGASNPLEIVTRVEAQPLPRLALSFPQAEQFAELVSAMTQKRRDHRPDAAAEALAWMREICAK